MSKSTIYVKKLVLIALLGASLNAFKFCLMYIPNVEVVTLLIVAYSYVFGLGIGFPAAMVFCVLEGFIWGFNPSWLFSYFLHWGALSSVGYLLAVCKIKKPLIIAIIIAIITALFGVQSTFMYYLTGGAVGKVGWVDRYIKTYLTGTVFYITHVVSNFFILLFAFDTVKILLNKLKQSYLPTKNTI